VVTPPQVFSAKPAMALTVLSGGAMRGFLDEAIPLFERASGQKVQLRFGLTSALTKEIENGAIFDIVLLPRPEIDALVPQGKIVPGKTTDIARSAVGIAVRVGAPKPDIGTVAAFKRMLGEAQSITYSDGPSGLYIAGLLQRLGLAEAMKPKTRLTTGPVAELVAKGEAEIGLQQIAAILPVKGAELVGPLPPELQSIIVYAAGLSAGVQSGEGAAAFVTFMATPEAHRILRTKGLEPG
jgi:molybdate transport system substrate-binding protein